MRRVAFVLVVPAVVIGYCLLYAIQVRGIPYSSTGYPLTLAGLLVALLVPISWGELRHRAEIQLPSLKGSYYPVVIVVLSFLYAALSAHFGFTIASAIYLSGLFWVLGNRGVAWLLFIPSAASIAIFITMTRLLEVPLPSFAWAELPFGF